jgi:hypothetical protein
VTSRLIANTDDRIEASNDDFRMLSKLSRQTLRSRKISRKDEQQSIGGGDISTGSSSPFMIKSKIPC